MTIGGIDNQLVAPAGVSTYASILAVCQQTWPNGVFLDADETELIPLRSQKLAWHSESDEFFVYSDRATAEAWEELGPCPENWNRMLHFLRGRGGGPFATVTVVLDELTPDTRQLLEDLQDTFREAAYSAPALTGAA